MKSLGSTFSTSTPNLCLNCEEGGKKSDKLRKGVAAKEESKITDLVQDENKTEKDLDTGNVDEHLLTE